MKSHAAKSPTESQTTAQLDIYIADECSSCSESKRLAELVSGRYPTINVRTVNLSEPDAKMPEQVVAVPTFVLNGNVLHLGNPHEDWLLKEMEQATSIK